MAASNFLEMSALPGSKSGASGSRVTRGQNDAGDAAFDSAPRNTSLTLRIGRAARARLGADTAVGNARRDRRGAERDKRCAPTTPTLSGRDVLGSIAAMKKHSKPRKLVLATTTVRNLSTEQLENVAGAAPAVTYLCTSRFPTLTCL